MLGEERAYFVEVRGNTKLPHVVLSVRGKTFHFVVVTARSDSGLKIRNSMETDTTSKEK